MPKTSIFERVSVLGFSSSSILSKVNTSHQNVFMKGFSLIELVVVIAILGVLATVLIAVIDPVDKINSANDAGVIRTIAQMARANDTYAVNNNAKYVGSDGIFANAVAGLFADGDIKYSSITKPPNYVFLYFTNPTNCTTNGDDCLDYFVATTLKSKKNNPGAQGYYFMKDGRGCRVSTATPPTIYTSFDSLYPGSCLTN